MTNRISLLADIERLQPSLNATSVKSFQKSLDKAIAVSLPGLDLDSVRKSGPGTKQAVADALNDCLVMADLKKVSKKWDPKRTVAKSVSHSELVEQLLELVHGGRDPFVPCVHNLAVARAMPANQARQISDGISRFASPAQVKSLLKKWDPALVGVASFTEQQMRNHLALLLSGRVEPTPKPVKKKR